MATACTGLRLTFMLYILVVEGAACTPFFVALNGDLCLKCSYQGRAVQVATLN